MIPRFVPNQAFSVVDPEKPVLQIALAGECAADRRRDLNDENRDACQTF